MTLTKCISNFLKSLQKKQMENTYVVFASIHNIRGDIGNQNNLCSYLHLFIYYCNDARDKEPVLIRPSP